MAYLLHLETATEVCSVAVSQDDRLLALEETLESYRHAERLTLMIEAVCERAGITLAELNAVSLSSGPGSYTSLRIGTATAKGLCYALGIPLLVVDTLAALTEPLRLELNAHTHAYPMIDARRMEVYTAGYGVAGQRVAPLRAEILDETSFAAAKTAGFKLLFIGNGAAKFAPFLGGTDWEIREGRCSAKYLVRTAYELYRTASFADVAYYTPTYLKPPNITKSKKKLL